MLHVTPRARGRIHAAVEDEDGIARRLEPDEDGCFRLRPGAWRSGDMSYAADGSAILLVEGALAHQLADRALDVRSGELELRPREGSGSWPEPPDEAPPGDEQVAATPVRFAGD